MAKKTSKCKTMTKADIAKYQKVLADIGSGKREGFIFLGTTDGKEIKSKRGNLVESTGITFTHHVDPINLVANLIDSFELSKGDAITAALLAGK